MRKRRDIDPYVYLGSNVLINRQRIRNAVAAEQAERDFSCARGQQLYFEPVRQTFDLKHLRRIHRQLFQDMYDWAGDLRTIDIRKGNHEFVAPAQIQRESRVLFTWLRRNSGLLRLHIQDGVFIVETAKLLYQLNRIRPFREGNGRTQRHFLYDVAILSGRELDWSKVSPERNLTLSIRAHLARSPLHLESIIESALVHSIA